MQEVLGIKSSNLLIFKNFYFYKGAALIMRAAPLLLLANIIFTTCKKENLSEVPEAVRPYLDTFLYQASIRGFDYRNKIRDIDIEFGQIEQDNVNGTCFVDQDKIVLDSNAWKNSRADQREFVVCHELGHCLLNRGHVFEKSKREECCSIMRSHENGFFCQCNFISRNWRRYYYDELFGPSCNIDGDIYQNKTNIADYPEKNRRLIRDTIVEQERMYIYESDFTFEENAFIEFNIKEWGKNNIFQVYLDQMFLSFRIKPTNEFLLKTTQETLFFRDNNDLNFSETELTIRLLYYKEGILVFANGNLLHKFSYTPPKRDLTLRTNEIDHLLPIKVSVGFVQ